MSCQFPAMKLLLRRTGDSDGISVCVQIWSVETLPFSSNLTFRNINFRIAEFERKEKEKAIHEEAHHDLESLAVDLSDKLTQDEFSVLISLFIFK